MAPQRAVPDHRLALTAIFLTAYATNVSTPFLVAYRDRLDLGPTETQTIFVVYVGGILTTLLFAGPAADRFGRKPMTVPFVALAALASFLIVLGRDSYPLLLAGRCMLGVSVGAVLAVGTAWVQELLGPGTQVKAAVWTTLATYVGFGFGPAISSVLELVAPWPLVTPFVLHIVLTLVVLPFLMRIPETRPATSSRSSLRPNLGVPRNGRIIFWLTVVPAAIWVFAFPSTSFALFPVLLSEAMPGNEIQVAGAASTLTAWSAIAARPILNRWGSTPTLISGMTMGFSGYLLGTTAFWTGGWPLVLPAAMLLGAASGCITAGCLAILGAIAEDHRRGALTSTFYLFAYPCMSMPVIVTSL
ncbi:MAG: MFS transporter, partial [Acidimicrobiia bacterium]|nr:MFS transporter [Acidimicrobiia bacterium]